ncbi:MAG: hypothetical protein ACT4PL_02190 [Phycisphaerales bacterium]
MNQTRTTGRFSLLRSPPRGFAWPGVVGVVVAVAVCAGGALWLANRGGASAAMGHSATLDLATAATVGFDVTTTASGELEARNQIEIRNRLETQTTIQDIVREGVTVKSGDLLVQLNAEEIERQVEENQLTVESAKAELSSAENAYSIQLSENESALRKAILDVDIAQLDLRKWQEGDVVSKRQANDLALDKSRRELDRLKDKYEQAVRLETKGFLSKDELKRDELAYLEAVAALQTAELAKRTYEDFELPKDQKTRESAVDDAKAELDRTRSQNDNQITTREAERVNKRQQLALRQSRLDRLVEQVKAARIIAPNDGLVVHASSLDRGNRWGGGDEGPLQIGKQVFPNQLMIVLPDTSEMVASVRVQESIAGKVKPGQSSTVKIDALGGKSLRGTVQSVGVIAENGGWRDPNLREYTIKILLELPDGIKDIRPSMRCEAEITLDRVDNALVVPVQAVFSEGLVRYVHVAGKGATFSRKPVRVGRRSDRFAEIAVGVTEGDRVLVRKPTPAEVLDTPWAKAELTAVGLDLSSDGKVIPMGGAGPGGDRRPSGPAGATRVKQPAIPASESTPRVAPTAKGEQEPSTKPAHEADAAKPSGTEPTKATPAREAKEPAAKDPVP